MWENIGQVKYWRISYSNLNQLEGKLLKNELHRVTN